MKKLLPILLSFVFVFTALLHPVITFAQLQAQQSPTDSRWVIDPEVTFIGKNARRSGDFLNWTLQNYNWVCVKQNTKTGQCDNSNNPIEVYWSSIVLTIVVPMLLVVILATSMVIIITRGKSLTIMRFIPRFVAVVLLIVFSYSLLQFFYQFTDLIQGFFLRSNIAKSCPPTCISDKDLLYVGWNYNNFVGLRLLGDKYAESAFISLLLAKLTALTYFVMVFLLLVRKIILWFFIIVSPIFPILLLYYPVRNTGKIWIGEFFRWLLYAPLFAIFLNGLVYLWRNQIPLGFYNPNIGNPSSIEYPTAVNILLGGPKQVVSPTNSVNLVETFALYVVSLIMLWIVILLPWILLQIFLDYAQNFAPGDTAVMKTLVNMATTRNGAPSPKPSVGGSAISLPFAKKFSVPIDLKPGPMGAAREISMQGTTLKATINQPLSLPNASINAQILSAAKVKIPTIRDIARFDVALRSRDSTKQQEVSRFSQQLIKIATPVVVTNSTERNQLKEAREKILQQSQRGNPMATSLLRGATASSHSMTTISNQKMKDILSQIANPALATGTNRDTMMRLNTLLKQQSVQKKNELASSILKVNSSTNDQEIQKIKEKLLLSSHGEVGRSLMTAIAQSERPTMGIKDVIKQIANPTILPTTVDKERVAKLRGTLEKASKEGNQLASSILAINERTSLTEIDALQKRIQEAKEKGEPMATEVASLARAEEGKLPMINRIQTVSKEDYQAVRDMWKQNYQNIELPQGMAGSRTDWIKDDIAGIDETISLLSSQDPDKVQQGMDQVSTLLPFLLVGGFSQTEIIEYLKAKRDAATDVSTSLAAEEEEKVSVMVKPQHTQVQQAVSATIIDEANEEEIPSNPLRNTKPFVVPQQGMSLESLNIAELKLPKMQDIAKYETQIVSKNTTEPSESRTLLTVLEKIANPMAIPDKTEQEKYEKIQENLITEREKGNLIAAVVLSAANKTKAQTSEGTKQYLSQIANPSLVTREIDKKRFSQLHELLTKASQEGNALATAILSTKQTTQLGDIEKLSAKLQAEKEKGDTAIANVLPDFTAPEIPQQNTLQQVTQTDFDEVRKMWEENYRTLPVPQAYGSDRVAWITADTTYVEETIELLTSPEKEKQQEGSKRVSAIMPILLLGGFSQQEVSDYLQAKLGAGKNVLTELQQEEENKVTVTAEKEKKEAANTLAVEEKPEKEKQVKS